ncbi:MAG: hypothetical protein WC498_01280 [Candidatus Saccharimonadales bacterium]
MGLFGNFFDAIESGALEKKLANVADKVDGLSARVDNSVDKMAEKPEKLAQNIDVVKNEASKTAKVIKSE